MCVHIYIYIYVHIQIRLSLSLYVCIYIYIYIYTHMYLFTKRLYHYSYWIERLGIVKRLGVIIATIERLSYLVRANRPYYLYMLMNNGTQVIDLSIHIYIYIYIHTYICIYIYIYIGNIYIYIYTNEYSSDDAGLAPARYYHCFRYNCYESGNRASVFFEWGNRPHTHILHTHITHIYSHTHIYYIILCYLVKGRIYYLFGGYYEAGRPNQTSPFMSGEIGRPSRLIVGFVVLPKYRCLYIGGGLLLINGSRLISSPLVYYAILYCTMLYYNLIY